MNQRHRIIWIQHGGERSWVCAIADMLRHHDIDSSFKCFMADERNRYVADGFDADLISTVIEAPNLGEEELIALERRFGPPSLSAAVLSDSHQRVLHVKDTQEPVQAFAKLLRYWEETLQRERPCAAVVRDKGSIWTRSAFMVARRLYPRMPFLQIGLGPDDSHFTFYDEGTQPRWSGLADALALSAGRTLSPGRKSEIDELVAQRVDRARYELRLKQRGARSLLEWPRYKWSEARALSAARAHGAKDPYLPTVLRLKRALYAANFRWRVCDRWRLPYSEPSEKERFVLFPLFHTEELINLLNGRFWAENVDALIRHVADVLPQGHMLYVKEHPVVVGDLSAARLLALSRHERIRLISPEVRGQWLAARAAAVITCGGTAGWEALLLRTPVVLIGMRPFYDQLGLVHRVNAIEDLDDVLFQALQKGRAHYEERIEDWYILLDAIWRTTHKGVFEKYEYPHAPDRSRENLEKAAAALRERLALASA